MDPDAHICIYIWGVELHLDIHIEDGVEEIPALQDAVGAALEQTLENISAQAN